MSRTLYIEAILTVTDRTHPNLATDDGVRDELHAWAESLNADVHLVAVRPADDPAGKEDQ